MGMFSMFHDDPQLSRIVGLSLSGRHKIHRWLVDTVAADTGASSPAAYAAVNAEIQPRGEAMLSDLAGTAEIYATARTALENPDASPAIEPTAVH